MYTRFMFALRAPSLFLAAALQLLPLVRTALPAGQTTTNLLAIIFRWGAVAAALDSVDAVSGASTFITTPLDQTVTNGARLGNSQIRLTTAPDQAGYWLVVGLPGGLYVTNTSSTAFYIRGTPTVTGDFNVSLTAKENSTSNKERTTTATMVIHVLDGAGGNSPPVANAQSTSTAEDIAKDITLTGSDPNGNPITFAIVTQPAHGTLTGSAPNVTYTPAANYNGPDSFTFKVNDGTADSPAATVSLTVTAVNDQPVATAQSVTTAEDTATAVTLTGADVESSPLNYSIVSAPGHGTLSGTAPNLTFTPANNYNGPDGFTFKVNDGTVDSSAATVSLTITAVNDAPIANAQSLATDQNVPKAITLTGSDVEGSPLTYAIVAAPAHGTLSGTAPNVTYTPANNYNGSDSFTFKVNDGTVDSPAATVSIAVASVNSAPVANAQSITTAEDTAAAITLTGSDVDGNPLTYTLVTQPVHGTLAGAAPNVTYTPTANYNGPDSFTFKVNDGFVDSTAATLSLAVTAVNDVPVASAQSVTTEQNVAKAITLGGTDVEGSPLTYAIVIAPAHGTLTGAAPNVTYTPATDYSGPDSFTFKANDGAADSSAATISIEVAGAVPTPTVGFGQPTVGPGGLTLSATGSPSLTWSVERATEPSGPWTNIGNLVIGPGGSGQFNDPNPPTGSAFYRTIKN